MPLTRGIGLNLTTKQRRSQTPTVPRITLIVTGHLV